MQEKIVVKEEFQYKKGEVKREYISVYMYI
jgi:hypothetical protein